LRRYDDLINHYFYNENPKKQQEIPEILNLLNTKYIVGGTAEKPEVQINPLANGNAWLVSDIQFANSPNEEIEGIGKIVTKRTAIVATSDRAYFTGKKIESDTTASVQLTKYQPNEIELKTSSKTPQLAVISEIYYPKGWKMQLDGKEVPYIKADYLLRAVYVPQGNHHIKMVFEPEVIEKGKWWSALAFSVFIIISLGGFVYDLKKKKNDNNS
jgi:hypothetical protein